jgi:kynurenine formamidase
LIDDILGPAGNCAVYDLAQPYYVGMPHHPVHPPYTFSMTKKHGDYVAPGGVSSAADAFGMGGHVGTHIDALCHFSVDGKLHGGEAAADAQSYAAGLSALSVETIAPILRRGVLLDIAALEGVETLPVDFTITPQHLEKAENAAGVRVRAGDIVLLRTGWARFWDDAARYIAEVRGPGPELAGAEWLSARGIFAAGSDTIAFEKVPARNMPVHVHLLVERGIHIIEALNMEELSRDGAGEFLFIAIPLRIRGGTGSPIRPIALVPKEGRRGR